MAPCLSLNTLTADGLLSIQTGRRKKRIEKGPHYYIKDPSVTILRWRCWRHWWRKLFFLRFRSLLCGRFSPFSVEFSPFLCSKNYTRAFAIGKGQGKLNGITWHFWGSMSIMSLGRYRLNYARTNNFVHMHTTNILQNNMEAHCCFLYRERCYAKY